MICKVLMVCCVCQIGNNAIGQNRDLGYSGSTNLKITSYLTINGGWGIGLGAGYWLNKESKEYGPRFQPSVNLSLNLVGGHSNLGNKNRSGSRHQVNLVLSPVLITGWGKKVFYEELRVFYYGNSNAVYANDQFHFALGTSLVLSPKSNINSFQWRRNYQNISSRKNKSQQLIYVGFRAGGRSDDSSRSWSIKINFYEDHMLLPLIFQTYADHYDRYYTGGGNVGLSMHFNGNATPFELTIYNDVYTGTFERDMFDFPDIYEDPNEPRFNPNLPRRSRKGRFVSQEPGEKMLNAGRFFGTFRFPISQSPTYRALVPEVTIGRQGGKVGMGFQNMIHNMSRISKINDRYEVNSLYPSTSKYRFYFERLHHFYPIAREPRMILGIGLTK